MSIAKKVLKIVLIVLLALILVVCGYLAYYTLSYKRIEDNLNIDANNQQKSIAYINRQYKAITYNIGFGAYTPDFGFFMDGGKEGRAKSSDSVKSVINGIIALLLEKNPDIVFMQEVDYDSTRSHKIDEVKMLQDGLGEYANSFIQNYDSPYLIYPLFSQLGANKSGMMLFTKLTQTQTLRRSLPVEEGLAKYFDLDRCYSVTRVEVDNKKTLCLYTVHLSAYTSDGKISDDQLKILVSDMKKEYDKGNYVICGGDFNKDVLGNSCEVFGVDNQGYTWAQPFKTEYLIDTGLSLVDSLDKTKPVPTSRNADGPYNENQFVVSIDGFIVSDNIRVDEAKVVDTGFAYSDHNPVEMTFVLL